MVYSRYMGQEIPNISFSEADFWRFDRQLKEESEVLRSWFEEDRLDNSDPVAGCELEVWLVDDQGQPVARNVQCLESLPPEAASPELSQFNIELNFAPVELKGKALGKLYSQLKQGWSNLCQVATDNQVECVCTGILPTVTNEHLTLAAMSPLNRYYALNEQVLAQRPGEPIKVDIVGHEHLQLSHHDVMLEAATTSFQMHLKVGQQQAARYMNASTMLSAPLVALAANSPYLFGYDLWEETRIPVFEQSVAAGGFHHAAHGPLKRITFGNDYVRESLWEYFDENLQHYPVLLPHDFRSPAEELKHLQLHNGTIWRWNRPLVGFNADGQPHLRIEQRVIPSGPTLVDMVANMAFYYGLVTYLAGLDEPPEMHLDFAIARDNFYQAARYGLDTHIRWPMKDNSITIKRLILDELLEQAWQGLELLGIEGMEIKQWLGVVEQRVLSGQTGSVWQRQYVLRQQTDMQGLLKAYRARQNSDIPVHEWDFSG